MPARLSEAVSGPRRDHGNVQGVDRTGVQYNAADVLDFGANGDLGYQIVHQTSVQPKRNKTGGGLFITLLRRQPDTTWLIYAYISTA